MKTSLHQLIADPRLVALTFRQRLEPLEGRDVPLHPPTYPPQNKTGSHRHDTPYTVNRTRDGGWLCELDSVQSQANRMEAAYTAALADVVPHHVVRAGRFERDLTALPHRIADAAIRASALGPRIREAFEAFAAGDAMPLARLAPTSLVYGAWDSRDTRVAIPRAVVSAIRAANVSVLTSSAQYSGAFTKSALGLTDSEWTRGGARAGFAPSPDINRPGGVLVHGEIVQSASVMLDLLRRYGAAPGADRLPAYLLGLSAGGLLTPGRAYHLRSGCALVPEGPGQWRAVTDTGERRAIALETGAVLDELRDAARAWAAAAGVALGGAPTVHAFDAGIARGLLGREKGTAEAAS